MCALFVVYLLLSGTVCPWCCIESALVAVMFCVHILPFDLCLLSTRARVDLEINMEARNVSFCTVGNLQMPGLTIIVKSYVCIAVIHLFSFIVIVSSRLSFGIWLSRNNWDRLDVMLKYSSLSHKVALTVGHLAVSKIKYHNSLKYICFQPWTQYGALPGLTTKEKKPD